MILIALYKEFNSQDFDSNCLIISLDIDKFKSKTDASVSGETF